MDEEILLLEKNAMERWRNGDPWGFVEISAEEISYFDPGLSKPIIGLPQYKQYMESAKGKIHYQQSKFIDPKIVKLGNTALLTYNYRSAVITEAGTIQNHAPWNATEVYSRKNGKWMIVHTHWSFIDQKLPDICEIPLPVQIPKPKYSGLLGELMTLESGAMERWRKGDPWGFIEISAPEVTYFDTGTPKRIDGREALSAEYKLREGKILYDVMDFIDPRVQDYGDTAVLFYRFLSTWLNHDGSVSQRIPWNCTEVFNRINGNWRIIHTHWSFIQGEKK